MITLASSAYERNHGKTDSRIYPHFSLTVQMAQCRSFSLHEPSDEAKQTIESILVDGTSMKLLPTHCINAAGELEGFQFLAPNKAKGGILPINRTMFHGTSLFEVNCAPSNGVFNADIMRLMQTTDGSVRGKRGHVSVRSGQCGSVIIAEIRRIGHGGRRVKNVRQTQH